MASLKQYDVILIGDEPQGIVLTHLLQDSHSVLCLKLSKNKKRLRIPSIFSSFFSFSYQPTESFYFFTKGKTVPWKASLLGEFGERENEILFSKMEWTSKKEKILRSFLKSNPDAYLKSLHISNTFGFNSQISYEKKLYQAFLFSEQIEILPPEGIEYNFLSLEEGPLELESQKKEVTVKARSGDTYQAKKVIINCSLDQLQILFPNWFSPLMSQKLELRGTPVSFKETNFFRALHSFTLFLTQNYLNYLWIETEGNSPTLWCSPFLDLAQNGLPILEELQTSFPYFDFQSPENKFQQNIKLRSSVCTLQPETKIRNVLYIGDSLRSDLPHPLGPFLTVRQIYQKHFEKPKR